MAAPLGIHECEEVAFFSDSSLSESNITADV